MSEWSRKIGANQSSGRAMTGHTYISRHDGQTHVIPLEPLGEWAAGDQEDYEADPCAWMDKQAPTRTLRCAMSQKLVSNVWLIPDGQILVEIYRGGTRQGLDEFDGDHAMVRCPAHGWVLVPKTWVSALVSSPRRHGNVQCCDPAPVYAMS